MISKGLHYLKYELDPTYRYTHLQTPIEKTKNRDLVKRRFYGICKSEQEAKEWMSGGILRNYETHEDNELSRFCTFECIEETNKG